MPIPWLHTTVRTIVLIGLIITWIGTIIPIFPAPSVMWGLILVYGISAGFETRGWIFFAIISVLTIISMLADNFFTIRGARQGGARWASVAIASVIGLIASLTLTPIGGILVSVSALFAAETAFTHNTETAWEATRQWLLGWGWATAVRLAIGFVALMLWLAWAWL